MTELHGWGRYPRVDARVEQPASRRECIQALREPAPLIARGMGRSYGDSSLAPRVLCTASLDRFSGFDRVTGILGCDAGVSLQDILRLTVPLGWFLPVLPGTRFVSVGGAIASDVHGKNHHLDGTFGKHVLSLELLLGNGELVRASAVENADLFHATCGGMGLTGVILGATLQLRTIQSSDMVQTTIKARDLDAVLDAFEANAAAPYSVAWIDCLATGPALGRSLLMLGEHAITGPLEVQPARQHRVPFDLPGQLLNEMTARAFNAFYYRKAGNSRTQSRVPFEPFFHPLDALANWNRLYGAAGFVQYQVVLPKESGRPALRQLLGRIAASGQASFLAVLKAFGPANANLLSFPLEGYTLALDFKAQPEVFGLLARLDLLVLEHGGRIYLTKDARMTKDTFRAGYPRWQEFESTRARWHAHGRFASGQSRRLGLL